MPSIHVALQRLDSAVVVARQQKSKFLKVVHGYGSSGEGGDIRIAVQKRLVEMASRGDIRSCLFGERWSKSDEQAWALIHSHPELKQDHDLGRKNLGITIVVL